MAKPLDLMDFSGASVGFSLLWQFSKTQTNTWELINRFSWGFCGFPSLPVPSFFAYGWKCCGCLRSVALMVYGLRWWVFGGPQITRLTKVESEPGESFREEQGRLCLGGLEVGVPGSCGLERLVSNLWKGSCAPQCSLGPRFLLTFH